MTFIFVRACSDYFTEPPRIYKALAWLKVDEGKRGHLPHAIKPFLEVFKDKIAPGAFICQLSNEEIFGNSSSQCSHQLFYLVVTFDSCKFNFFLEGHVTGLTIF